jgi:hypothetical protein
MAGLKGCRSHLMRLPGQADGIADQVYAYQTRIGGVVQFTVPLSVLS